MTPSYLARLSPRQRTWFLASAVVALLIVGLGILCERERPTPAAGQFTVDMNIREIAPVLNITGKGLARDLDLPLDAPKKKPLNELGISQTQLDHTIAHILSHRSTGLKYYMFTAIVLFGLVYMVRLGRPDGENLSERKLWYPRAPYFACLIAAVLVCGFVLGKSPNPMEGAVKVFKSMVGLYPSVAGKVIAMAYFLLLTVVGNKLICGWACPFGALQELIYSLPLLRKMKRLKAPFWLTNTIRTGLFLVMLLFLFGIAGNKKGFVIYHYLNPFNLFNLDFDHWLIMATVVVFLTLAFVVYRPFCHLICPFGLLSWIVERFSLTRIKVDHEKCTYCGACIKACPSEAAKGRVLGRLFAADCFSCARCLNVCPQDAIRYGSVFSTASSMTNQTKHSPEGASSEG